MKGEDEMNYHLQKYRTRATRHECPKCHESHSFTYYVDEDDQPLDPTCGRCDHESKCGYHYTPSDYFRDHQGEKPLQNFVSKTKLQSQSVKPLCTIPFKYVRLSASWNSILGVYLWGSLDWRRDFLQGTNEHLVLDRLMQLYCVGATKTKDIIFWQIDINGKVRSGKIMRYKANGHRVHNYLNWVHSKMMKAGLLPNDWQLTQCLFGEHLLNFSANKNKKVAVVESEKSALVGAACFPQYVWVATGGKSQLAPEKMKVLKGRTVIMFPDSDGFEEWTEKAKEFTFCNVKVSDVLEKNATDEEKANKIDVADWLIMQLNEGRYSPPIITEEYQWLLGEKSKSDLELMIEERPFIQRMIDDLALVPDD